MSTAASTEPSAHSPLDRYFGLTESGSTIGREFRAAIATFLTMSYILFVNPDILGKAIPIPDAFPQLLFATAAAAAIGSIVMGLVARYPFALAPGMGVNAYFAYTVVLGQGIRWQTALGAVFIGGLIFLLLSFGGVRQAIVNAMPASLKYATSAGIGMFLAIIGLENAGVVVASPATFVTLGHLTAPSVLIALLGLLITGALLIRRFPGAILVGIVGATAAAIAFKAPVYFGAGGMVPFPGLQGGLIQAPVWPKDLFLAMDIPGALGLGLVGIVFTFLFIDIFDTAGTLIGLSAKAGYLDEKGQLPRANAAFISDSTAIMAGAALGTSTTTAYIESAAGVEAGGRTGLTAVFVGLLFVAALFLWPLAAAVPGAATAPALILVGAMMMTHVPRIPWNDYEEAIPAFLCMAAMPFTFSIANGISFGIVAHVLLKLLSGKFKGLHWILVVLAALLIARYIWLGE